MDLLSVVNGSSFHSIRNFLYLCTLSPTSQKASAIGGDWDGEGMKGLQEQVLSKLIALTICLAWRTWPQSSIGRCTHIISHIGFRDPVVRAVCTVILCIYGFQPTVHVSMNVGVREDEGICLSPLPSCLFFSASVAQPAVSLKKETRPPGVIPCSQASCLQWIIISLRWSRTDCKSASITTAAIRIELTSHYSLNYFVKDEK